MSSSSLSVPRQSCISIESNASQSKNLCSYQLEIDLSWRRLQLSRSKLKQASKTSSLFAGFAMVAMVEVNFNNDPENPVPPILLVLFGVCTTLLVSVHILSLIISTCILPSIEAIALLECKEAVNDSPHERLQFFINLSWTLSSVIGVFLFFLEVIILCWVKFWEMGLPQGEPGKLAARVSTMVFCPFLVAFIAFAVYFYSKLADHKYESSSLQIKELEQMLESIEEANKSTNKFNPIEAHVAQKNLATRMSNKSPRSRSFYINLPSKLNENRHQKRTSIDSNVAFHNSAFYIKE